VIPVSPFVDQLLPALKLDVIHTHHPVLLGQTAAGKAEALGLPLIFTFHTQYQEYTHYFPLPQEAFQEFLKDAVQNWLMDFMGKCHHIIVPSESMKETLVRDYGLRDRYTVIPTGIDLELYRRAGGKALRSKLGWQKDKVLVSSGRLAQEKNWGTLFKAAKKVHAKHPGMRFVLIGDGGERESLQNLASDLGIADRVIFTGEVPFSEVVRYLKAADVFAFASVTETQGLVTMEALAAGLPVVAVDASGTRDIVEDGEQGYLVPNDADALADSIIRMFDSPGNMKKFRSKALKKAKEYDVKNCARQMVEVYKQAIQDRKDGQHVGIEKVAS